MPTARRASGGGPPPQVPRVLGQPRPSSKRCAAATPAGPGHTRQVEFEYRRGGTLAYFAAYDVHHARVIGSIEPKTGIDPFTDLVAKVMTSEPYASARRVFWVVDNGSSHAG